MTGGIHDRWDAGQKECRTGGIQERRDAGQEGCSTRRMQDRRDAKASFAKHEISRNKDLFFAKYETRFA